jgi:hypothetical protein
MHLQLEADLTWRGLVHDGRSEAGDDVAGATALRGHQDDLRNELRLCRLELAAVREENERLKEAEAQGRRGGKRAQREATTLAKALARVLYRELQAAVEGPRWRRVGRGPRVSQAEWHQVLLIHRSDQFKPEWYLRNHLTVARQGIEPALHFLRYGVVEGLDPGPEFDVKAYLDEHPEVRASGENPLIHALTREVAP